MKLRHTVLAVALAFAATLAIAFADDIFQGASVKKPFDPASNGKASKTSSTQILYHGGPVMNQANSVYVIYYGSVPSGTQAIINNFLAGFSGSSIYGVNHTYNDPTAQNPMPIPLTYTFAPPSSGTNPSGGNVYFDNGSQGTQLGSRDIPTIVAHALSGGLPANPNGVYLVITAPDIKISGFCSSFCAYHTATRINGMQTRYALIPDPTQRCSGCNGGIAVYGDPTTPNGDMGADTMTDDITHELSETVTDPDLNAWFTQNGAENGDLCNYVYGIPNSSVATVKDVNGKILYHYNATLNGHNYLIQWIWKNVNTGVCAGN